MATAAAELTLHPQDRHDDLIRLVQEWASSYTLSRARHNPTANLYIRRLHAVDAAQTAQRIARYYAAGTEEHALWQEREARSYADADKLDDGESYAEED